MPGRGDNNKHGSAGRGSSNQSNQPFTEQDKRRKSDHSRKHTGGEPSAESDVRSSRGEERQMNMVVDDVPYLVKVSPFSFNDEQRFYVSINGGTEHVFTWDSEIGSLRAIDDEASILPDALEEEISRQLQSKNR